MNRAISSVLAASLFVVGPYAPGAAAGDESRAGAPTASLVEQGWSASPFPITSGDYERLAVQPALTIAGVMLDRLFDLELTQVEAFSPDARLVVVTADGEQPLARPRVALFSGQVIGEDDSLAFLSVSPASVQGFIRHNSQTYIISCSPNGGGTDAVVFNLNSAPSDLFNWSPFECDALEVPGSSGGKGGAGGGSGGTGPRTSPCRIARIAFDTDNELLAHFGNNTEYATTYVATLVAGLSAIYKADVNTRIVSSYLRLWSAPDPWTKTNTGDQLGEFRDYWNANMVAVSRNAAHFLSMRPLGGGVAYVPALCNTPWAYAVSANLGGNFPFPLVDHSSQNWDIFVTAHELGHNFNAPHTHSTTPPIDNCGNSDCSQAWGGTIMSYCHTCSGGMTNIVLDLHPTIETNYILPYLGSDIGCNLSDNPTIYTQPANKTVCAYQPVTFTVLAASSNGSVSYQWYKNNVAISGANDYSFTILAPTSASAGNYAVVVSDGCGSTASATAKLTLGAPANCPVPGDVNGDGHVDLSDAAALLAQYGLCEGMPGFDYSADIIQDGCVNLNDLAVLLGNYGI